ncbi:HET-C-related protein [Chloroflexota bacterium]
MWVKYHQEITRKALQEFLPPLALNEIIKANSKQDALFYQLGHSHFHFDNNSFKESRSYIQDQRKKLFSCLEKYQPVSAWKHFGRLLHSLQDFFAHSNYVTLWLERFDQKSLPHHESIDACDEQILESSHLHSGRLYYPLEVLSFIPGIRTLVLPLLPRDSHAWMALDGPESGENFSFAFSAAVKRTKIEFEDIISELSVEQLALFLSD